MINNNFVSDFQSADGLSADFAGSIGREKMPDDYGIFLDMFSGLFTAERYAE